MAGRVTAPVIYDVSVSVDDQRLRNRVLAIHQRPRRLAVCPAQSEAEIDLAQELVDTSRRSTLIFCCQPDKLHIAPRVSLAHFLILRNFSTARTAPGRPKIYYDDFALEVREPEAAIVERFDLAFADALRQE